MGDLTDKINTAMRDFVRFTGDGKPGAPVGKPLPVGDSASGEWNPPKKQVRDAFVALAGSADDLESAAAAAANSADDADTSATQAQLAALAAGAPLYLTESEGIAGVADGKIFLVYSDHGVDVYTRNGAAADYEGSLIDRPYKTVADLVAANEPARGVGSIWQAGGFRYEEAASGATDHHITTAGGVKLYVEAQNNTYSPLQWGAKGDGIADDCKPIAAMFRCMENAEGVTFDFTGGDYKIDSTASIEAFTWQNMTYPASGILSYVDESGNDSYSTVTSIKRIPVFGLRRCNILGSGARIFTSPDWAGMGGAFDHGIFMWFNCKDMEFSGFIMDGNRRNLTTSATSDSNHLLYFFTDCHDWDIFHHTFYDAGDNYSGSFDKAGDGIYFVDNGHKRFNIHHNKFLENGRWGIALERGKTGLYETFFIENNYFFNNDLGSIDVETRGDVLGLTIADNTFDGRWTIAIGGNDAVDGVARYMTNIKILRNSFINVSGSGTYNYGITVGGGTQTELWTVLEGFEIVGNNFHRDDNGRDVIILGVAEFRDTTIKGNTFITAVRTSSATSCISFNYSLLRGSLDISENSFIRHGSSISISNPVKDTLSGVPENVDISIRDNYFLGVHYITIIDAPPAGGYLASSITLANNPSKGATASTIVAGGADWPSAVVYDRNLIDVGNVSDNFNRLDGLKLRTYADNAAAVTAGLVAGETYMTATGEVRVVV